MLQFEQLKKQKGKSQKAQEIKKNDEAKDEKEEPINPESSKQVENIAKISNSGIDGTEDQRPESQPADSEGVREKSQSEQNAETTTKTLHKRQPSLSIQSRIRSSSFRRNSVSQGPTSPNGARSPELSALTPDGDSINSIYRKKAARLDELEKENRRLAKESQEVEKRWRQTEEELEELREASGEVAELKSKVQQAEARTKEYNKLVRGWRTPSDGALLLSTGIRSKKTHPYNAKIPSSSHIPNVMHPPPARLLTPPAQPPLFKPS